MKKMMFAAWSVTLVMFVTAGSLLAHHSLAQFDTTTAVRIKGEVVLFDRVNPHSLLVLDEKRPDGQIRRWIVGGPPAVQLDRKGIAGYDFLKPGQRVEVCGYVTKPGVAAQRTITTETISDRLKGGISGFNMDGELLVTPDGTQRVWSDYGNHKCLAPGYKDQHSK